MRLPLSNARSMMCAAVKVLPKPVGPGASGNDALSPRKRVGRPGQAADADEGGGGSCHADFRFDAVELLENTDTRNDTGAQLTKMEFDSGSIAAPSSFRQTPRIALGKRARFNKSLEDEVTRRCNGFSGWTARGKIALIGSLVCGIQNVAGRQTCNIPRPGFRIRTGLQRFKDHRFSPRLGEGRGVRRPGLIGVRQRERIAVCLHSSSYRASCAIDQRL